MLPENPCRNLIYKTHKEYQLDFYLGTQGLSKVKVAFKAIWAN